MQCSRDLLTNRRVARLLDASELNLSQVTSASSARIFNLSQITFSNNNRLLGLSQFSNARTRQAMFECTGKNALDRTEAQSVSRIFAICYQGAESPQVKSVRARCRLISFLIKYDVTFPAGPAFGCVNNNQRPAIGDRRQTSLF